MREQTIYQQDDLAAFQAQAQVRAFVNQVFLWMAGALMVTALVAVAVVRLDAFAYIFQENIFIGLLIGEVVLVLILSAAINRIPASIAGVMFFVYSVMNGLTLSILFMVYTAESIGATFFITSATFAVMAIYGYTTNRDLTSLGSLFVMLLIGLVLASIMNWFMQSSALYWAITYGGIVIFVGLTAYDTQKVKMLGMQMSIDSEQGRKAAIIGALNLYLDFINLLILLLRLFGRRR